jgi:ABC-type branched-subunit amino acid transport system ATPase component
MSDMQAASPLLKAENLTMRFGGLTAVRQFGLEIASGEIVGLIGPNGAGKTTLLQHADRLLHADGRQGDLPRTGYHQLEAA